MGKKSSFELKETDKNTEALGECIKVNLKKVHIGRLCITGKNLSVLPYSQGARTTANSAR